MSRRRPWAGWALFVAFVVVPLVEIMALIQVGQVIGAWWTVVLLVADSVVGAWLVRREGRRAWGALTSALSTGRMPARELSDGALILIGGTLMLTPGFVTDAVGLLVILPLTRPFARRLLTRLVTARLVQGDRPPDSRHPGPGSPGSVVRGEVVDDDDDEV